MTALAVSASEPVGDGTQATTHKEEVSLPWPGRWCTAWSTSKIAPGFQGGSEWACPFCAHQVVYWPLHHKVMVTGQADAVHVRAMEEVPVHLDDIVVELTEADQNWLTLNAITWSDVVAR